MQDEFDKDGQKPETVMETTKDKLNKKNQPENINSNTTSPFGKTTHHVHSKIIMNEIEEIKADLKDSIEENDIREIFSYFNIGVFMYKDGTFGISEYRQPTENITFKDIGIDEANLIKDIVKISGNADFRRSNLTNLGKIKQIGGLADFRRSNFKPGAKLPKIESKIIFYENQTLFQGIMFKLTNSFSTLFK